MKITSIFYFLSLEGLAIGISILVAGAACTSYATNQDAHLSAFGLAWHYVGNTTLPSPVGEEICGIVAIPCVQFPHFPAEKYLSDKNSVAYVAPVFVGQTSSTGHVTVGETDALIVNSHVYCVWTNSTDPRLDLYNKCPRIVNADELPNSLNQQIKVTINNQDFVLRYNLTNGANIENIAANTTMKALRLTINSPSGRGELTLGLPRQLIDAKNPRHATPDCYTIAENGSRIYSYCDSDLDFTISISNNTSTTPQQKVASTIESTADNRH
jgi:hypothetical protein